MENKYTEARLNHFQPGPIGAASTLPMGTRLAPPLPDNRGLTVVGFVAALVGTGGRFALENPFSLSVSRVLVLIEFLNRAVFPLELSLNPAFGLVAGSFLFAGCFPLALNGLSSNALLSSPIPSSSSSSMGTELDGGR